MNNSAKLCTMLRTIQLTYTPSQLTDGVLKFFNWRSISSGLNRLRREAQPACQTTNNFINLLETHEVIRELFGIFKNQPFYRGSIYFGEGDDEDHVTVFIAEQLLPDIPRQCKLGFDGTFSILPLGYKQLFVINALINGK